MVTIGKSIEARAGRRGPHWRARDRRVKTFRLRHAAAPILAAAIALACSAAQAQKQISSAEGQGTPAFPGYPTATIAGDRLVVAYSINGAGFDPNKPTKAPPRTVPVDTVVTEYDLASGKVLHSVTLMSQQFESLRYLHFVPPEALQIASSGDTLAVLVNFNLPLTARKLWTLRLADLSTISVSDLHALQAPGIELTRLGLVGFTPTGRLRLATPAARGTSAVVLDLEPQQLASPPQARAVDHVNFVAGPGGRGPCGGTWFQACGAISTADLAWGEEAGGSIRTFDAASGAPIAEVDAGRPLGLFAIGDTLFGWSCTLTSQKNAQVLPRRAEAPPGVPRNEVNYLPPNGSGPATKPTLTEQIFRIEKNGTLTPGPSVGSCRPQQPLVAGDGSVIALEGDCNPFGADERVFLTPDLREIARIKTSGAILPLIGLASDATGPVEIVDENPPDTSHNGARIFHPAHYLTLQLRPQGATN